MPNHEFMFNIHSGYEQNEQYHATDYGASALEEFLHKESTREILKSTISKHPLVDLGCGTMSSVYGLTESLKELQPKQYIGVDRFTINNQEFYEELLAWKTHGLNIPASFIGEDMITFLQALPNSSANILFAGIEADVIVSAKNTDFVSALHKEVQRVVPQGGVFIDGASQLDIDFGWQTHQATYAQRNIPMYVHHKAIGTSAETSLDIDKLQRKLGGDRWQTSAQVISSFQYIPTLSDYAFVEKSSSEKVLATYDALKENAARLFMLCTPYGRLGEFEEEVLELHNQIDKHISEEHIDAFAKHFAKKSARVKTIEEFANNYTS